MTRIALQLNETFIATVCELVGTENHDVFPGSPYAIIEVVSPTEFTFKLVDEEGIFEAAKADSDLEILSF